MKQLLGDIVINEIITPLIVRKRHGVYEIYLGIKNIFVEILNIKSKLKNNFEQMERKNMRTHAIIVIKSNIHYFYKVNWIKIWVIMNSK